MPATPSSPGTARGAPLPGRLRRLLLAAGLGSLLAPAAPALGAAAGGGKASAPDTRALVFPRDFGSHPEQHTEWWYITGHCTVGTGAQARVLGFQLTFFRARVDATQALQSRFAARQLLFAHAAVTDVAGKRFWHDQRIARQGFTVAEAGEQDTDLRLQDWSLQRRDGVYAARIRVADFALELSFSETQPLLLQGDGGLSRKGPEATQASHYYSKPQLAFQGTIALQGQAMAVAGDGARSASKDFIPGRGAAWLDHEWSDGIMHPEAVGWDWTGMNLYDGSALMAFQMRDKSGRALWDGGAFRHPAHGGAPYIFSREEAVFRPLRTWKSPLTQASYPVEWLLRTPADNYIVKALLHPQELDSRGSTGAVYWEGLSDLLDGNRRPVGRGYLEMTGYARPLVL